MTFIHRETANSHDMVTPFPVPTAEEIAVLAAAREYYRTGGEAHNELMDAVQELERSYLNASTQPGTCFCGTGREHARGDGYHCRKADSNDHG